MTNYKLLISTTAILMLFVVLSFNVAAAPPSTLAVQGRLTDDTGTAITASTSVNFTLYTAYTGGQPIYEQVLDVNPDSNGFYTSILTGLSEEYFTNQLYLGVTVDTDDQMTPRLNLTTSPYAFVAHNVSCTNCINADQISDIYVLTAGDTMSGALTVSSVANPGIQIGDGSTGYLQIGDSLISDATGDLQLNSGTGEIYIDDELGIGTASPKAKLNVIGNINATGNITSGTGTVFIDGTNSKVGIGTSSPSQNLEVEGTSNTYIALDSSDTADSGVLLQENGNNRWYLKNEGATDYFAILNSSATEVLRIMPSGKIGFGANPGYPLEIFEEDSTVGNTDVLALVHAVSGGGASDGISTGLVFETEISNGIYVNMAAIRGIGVSADVSPGFEDGNLAFYTTLDGSSVERVRIDENGNVGINTDSPAEKLDVAGGIRSTQTNNPSSGTGLEIGYNTGSDFGRILAYNRTGSAYKNIGIGINSGRQLYLKNDGNVGIGTNSPESELHVIGEVNVSGVSGDGTGKVICIKSDGNFGTCSDQPGGSGTCTCS